jgi:transposase
MADRASRKEQCRVLYSQGLSLAKVAERVSLSEATVTRYKKQVKGTDQDWDKLRADLKGKTHAWRPEPVRRHARGHQPDPKSDAGS